MPAPVIRAIMVSFTGAETDDFHSALQGPMGGDPDGVIVTDPDPPWSAVLVFPEVSPARAADPVLFEALDDFDDVRHELLRDVPSEA